MDLQERWFSMDWIHMTQKGTSERLL